jgi:hypothetical protein
VSVVAPRDGNTDGIEYSGPADDSKGQWGGAVQHPGVPAEGAGARPGQRGGLVEVRRVTVRVRRDSRQRGAGVGWGGCW